MKILSMLILIFTSSLIFAQEICDNGIDDDGDGLVDLNDEECNCEGFGRVVESLIPNPSFEEMDCCPLIYSELECATTWVQASDATSDYFNTCGITDIEEYGPIPAALPLPGGGAGWVGFYSSDEFYREYVGACLDSPMLAGVNYTLNFYSAWGEGSDVFDIAIFGTPNCADLPWFGLNCPIGIGDWELLQTARVSYLMDGSWVEVTMTFTPLVDINAITIGGGCEDVPLGTYLYVDGLTLIDSDSFSEITQIGDWCEGEMQLQTTTDTIGGDWQWYKDGVALDGETDDIIDITAYGFGVYSSVYTVGDNCQRSNKTISILEEMATDFEVEIVCLGQESVFENTTIVTGGTTWRWDFGDGSTSTDENPLKIYDEAGLYTVSLIAENGFYCNDTVVKSVYVAPIPIADIEFIADGESSEDGSDGGCIINPVQFSDNSTIDDPDVITEWLWSFGDGTTSSVENPAHTYGTEGTYTVTLTVTTESGCSSTISIEIIMTESISIDVITNEPTCYGFSDGSIIINIVSGGGGGDDVIYEIKDAEGNVLNIDNSNAANSLPAGTYTY